MPNLDWNADTARLTRFFTSLRFASPSPKALVAVMTALAFFTLASAEESVAPRPSASASSSSVLVSPVDVLGALPPDAPDSDAVSPS